MIIISVDLDPTTGIPVVPDEIKQRVRNGERISIEILPQVNGFAKNALRHGVAGLNVDGARIPHNEECKPMKAQTNRESMTGNGKVRQGGRHESTTELKPSGRWPANLLLDEAAAEMLDAQTGDLGKSAGGKSGHTGAYGGGYKEEHYEGALPGYGDSGGPSRFFYVAKASKAERQAGLDDMPEHNRDASRNASQPSMNGGEGNPYNRGAKPVTNHHPTVKPIALMRYLVRLTATPTGGIVLDPFCGSGSTGIAAVMEKRSFIGIEINGDYLEIAKRRIAHAQKEADIVPTAKTGDGEKEAADLPLFGGQQ